MSQGAQEINSMTENVGDFSTKGFVDYWYHLEQRIKGAHTMLNDETIKKELKYGGIDISVAFYETQEGNIESYAEEKNILESPLSKNIYSDRVKLTLGPLVKVLDNVPIPKKNRFKNMIDCYDLRTNGNKYVLKPGESIILITNEKIKLNGNFGCLVIPRISLSDVGIVVSTAYVDPYYHGVMRLHMINLSKNPYELKVVEAIAQCFFFKLTNSVSIKYQEEFSAKSVFYGQTWNGILQTDRIPFPTKKNSIVSNTLENIAHQLKSLIGMLQKYSLLIIIITNAIAILVSYNALLVKFENTEKKVNYITEWLNPTASEILVKQGKTNGEKEIIVDCPKADIITVLCNNDDISYRIASGNTNDESIITFTYELSSKTNTDYEINFTYVIVKRSK